MNINQRISNSTKFNRNETALNSTEVDRKTNTLYQGITTIVICLCIRVFGVLGNSFTIFILTRSSSMRKKLVNIFLINQSVVDLGASIFLVLMGYNKLEAEIRTFSGWKADLYCRLIGNQLPLWSLYVSSTWNLVLVNV